ncbi:MAG: nucleotidyltransferase domain-containing protein [Nanoarchaeota archaeon]|nr:nucleotidyltransferase domain-containing protein [Nanoarchaeota archaeon]
MVKKKIVKKKFKNSKKKHKTVSKVVKPKKTSSVKKRAVDLRDEKDIAMDFAVRVYKKFDKMIKAIVLFGSASRGDLQAGSDVDVILIIDDASIQWDQELIAWYREELGKIVLLSKYTREVHITTTRLTTWWADLLRGDPVVTNVLRYGEALIDVGGFFNPLKSLLAQGRINSTPEAIYTALQRAPLHLRRSQMAELGAIDGLYWAMVDSAQAALMSARVTPPSPDHISILLKETFVDSKMLNLKYVVMFRDLYELYKSIVHQKTVDLKGGEIQKWQEATDDFIGVMAGLVKKVIESQK